MIVNNFHRRDTTGIEVPRALGEIRITDCFMRDKLAKPSDIDLLNNMQAPLDFCLTCVRPRRRDT